MPVNEYKFDDVKIGMKALFEKQVTNEMEDRFREISGDENPLHKDDEFAVRIRKGKFRQHVSFGMLTASMYSTLAGVYLPGKYSLIHSIEDLKFLNPVYTGDILKVSGEVMQQDEGLHLVILKCRIDNQNGRCVSKAKMKVLVMA